MPPAGHRAPYRLPLRPVPACAARRAYPHLSRLRTGFRMPRTGVAPPVHGARRAGSLPVPRPSPRGRAGIRLRWPRTASRSTPVSRKVCGIMKVARSRCEQLSSSSSRMHPSTSPTWLAVRDPAYQGIVLREQACTLVGVGTCELQQHPARSQGFGQRTLPGRPPAAATGCPGPASSCGCSPRPASIASLTLISHQSAQGSSSRAACQMIRSRSAKPTSPMMGARSRRPFAPVDELVGLAPSARSAIPGCAAHRAASRLSCAGTRRAGPPVRAGRAGSWSGLSLYSKDPCAMNPWSTAPRQAKTRTRTVAVRTPCTGFAEPPAAPGTAVGYPVTTGLTSGFACKRLFCRGRNCRERAECTATSRARPGREDRLRSLRRACRARTRAGAFSR